MGDMADDFSMGGRCAPEPPEGYGQILGPKIHMCIQGSDEWFAVRLGKMSASHASAIGNCGKGLDTYCIDKAAEFISGEQEHISNIHIERGIELEPEAKAYYEQKNNCKIDEIGFAEYNEYVGVSPDGLVGEDGLIEIKCPAAKGYLYALLGAPIKSEYMWQMQMQMLVMGRDWCDFVQYNPNFVDCPMLTTRVYPDEDKQAALLEGFKSGEQKIKDILERVKQYV